MDLATTNDTNFEAPLATVEARYADLLQRLGVQGHDGAVTEITALRKGLGAGTPVGGWLRYFRSRMNCLSIWGEKQNKVSQVVRDLAEWAPADVVYEALLRRGVFKWLAVRRDLIRLKDVLRMKITGSIMIQRHLRELASNEKDRHLRADLLKSALEERGYRRALEEVRGEIRFMCHSERWRVQDNDRAAKRWLKQRGNA